MKNKIKLEQGRNYLWRGVISNTYFEAAIIRFAQKEKGWDKNGQAKWELVKLEDEGKETRWERIDRIEVIEDLTEDY
jgi:hypothetical protein